MILAVGVLACMAVLFTRAIIGTEVIRAFISAYPGITELPSDAPVGIPAWLSWQHFLNVFLMVLIIRSGWMVHTEKKPPATWAPRRAKSGSGRISLTLWTHQALDLLWLVNGIVFVVLLAITGQWKRVVPISWDFIPNAASALLQYVSLNWPVENGWTNYNSLQVLTYFVTIFVAAPLAALTGIRLSPLWKRMPKALSRAYPVEVARAIHLPVMFYFVAFITVHVALVFATGALRNLNHMYAGQDVVNWTGFWIFLASIAVLVAGWMLARPLFIAPVARVFGTVHK